MLDSRKHDLPPKKGLAARQRTQRAPPVESSANNTRRRSTSTRPNRSAAQQSGLSSNRSAAGTASLIERELIAAIRQTHQEACAHGFPRSECYLRPLSATVDSVGGHVQFPASPTLIGSVEGPTKQARGDAPDDPAPSCPAEGSDSGAGGPPGGPKPASQEAAGPPPHCAAPGVATLRGAQGAGPGAARGKVPRGGAPFSPHLVGNSLLTRCDPK